MEKGNVVVTADEFFDGFVFVGALHDVWCHAFEDVADTAIVFDEFGAERNIGFPHGFFNGDAFGVPIRRAWTDIEHKFVFKERREAKLRAFHVAGEKDDAERFNAREDGVIDFIAFRGMDIELKVQIFFLGKLSGDR